MAYISRQDAIKNGLTRYFTGTPCKNGHIAERRVSDFNCIVCSNIKSRNDKIRKPEYMKFYYQKHYNENKKHILSRKKKDYDSDYSLREYKKSYQRLYYEHNKERIREYRDKNPHLKRASAAARRARRIEATPKWLTQKQRSQMAKMYRDRPEGYHVDHIIPLNGNGVCGLHVPWNLQYLQSEYNVEKGNSFDDSEAISISVDIRKNSET